MDVRPRALRIAAPLLAVAALALTIRYIVVTWTNRIPTDATFPYANLIFTDFRDAVWLPSRFLLAGHDPYDDAAFLAAHPATQGYSPYTPSHLLLTIWAGLLDWPAASLVWSIVMGVALAAMGGWTGYAVLRTWRGTPLGATLALTAVSVGVLAVWIWRPTVASSTAGCPSRSQLGGGGEEPDHAPRGQPRPPVEQQDPARTGRDGDRAHAGIRETEVPGLDRFDADAPGAGVTGRVTAA